MKEYPKFMRLKTRPISKQHFLQDAEKYLKSMGYYPQEPLFENFCAFEYTKTFVYANVKAYNVTVNAYDLGENIRFMFSCVLHPDTSNVTLGVNIEHDIPLHAFESIAFSFFQNLREHVTNGKPEIRRR